jgi:sugar phosphate isomerase/epimerase
VEIPDRTRQLIGLYAGGMACSAEFQGLRQQMLAERKAQAAAFFHQALKSLEELNRYAQKQKISLGIETRFYLREIPDFAETGVILREFKDSNIFYWHDTGHAQVMDNLKFSRQRDYLEAYGSRMLGIHLHNVIGCLDHQPPHKGSFDFKLLLPYVKKETIKIIEAHQPATADDLRASKDYLEEIFDGGN